MAHNENKTERVLRMLQILKSHPQGLVRSDLARLLSINPSTVCRYIRDISLNLPIAEDEDNKIYIEPDKFTTHMELDIHELIFIHLSSRLFLRSLDRPNPHTTSCLRKLARVFREFSPDISRFLEQTVAQMNKRKENYHENSSYLMILKDLTTAWVLQRKILITHFSHRSQSETSYLLHPHWLEPSSGKTSIYVIGYSEEEKQFRTLKIDRIKKTELLKETFTVQPGFKVDHYLDHAWGVWKSDNSPIEIVLKFKASVAERVLENSWHEEEQTEFLADGSLLWKARIAQPREMYPWIRGWGSDVEVVAPHELRTSIREEIEKMRKIYEN